MLNPTARIFSGLIVLALGFTVSVGLSEQPAGIRGASQDGTGAAYAQGAASDRARQQCDDWLRRARLAMT